MKVKRRELLLLTTAAVLVVAGLTVGKAFASKGGGAVYTTDVNGSATNQNQFASKGDVFVNGGPQNNCGAAGMADGDYVFQVTDPSGKTLLSSDDVVQRRFRVAGGMISAYLGNTHATSDGPCGAKTVGLAPFNGSSNGEYKVWVVAAGDYNASKGTFGFPNNSSKTDNFKIASSGGTGGGNSATFLGRSYQDLNLNGTDDSEAGVANAAITVVSVDTASVVASAMTDAGGYYTLSGISAGTYDVCQAKPASWYFTQPAGGTGCARHTVSGGSTVAQNFGNAPENID